MGGTTVAHEGVSYLTWSVQNTSYPVSQDDTYLNHPATVGGLPLPNHGRFIDEIAEIETLNANDQEINGATVTFRLGSMDAGPATWADFEYFKIRVESTAGTEVCPWTDILPGEHSFPWGAYEVAGSPIPCILFVDYELLDEDFGAGLNWNFTMEVDVTGGS